MTSKIRFQVFLSYSRQDSDLAHRIAKYLSENDLEVWIDTVGLEPGTPHWGNMIQDAINQSFVVVWIASPNGKSSPYIKDEVDTALSQGITVIPAWIEGDNWHQAAWLGAGQMQYIDCRAAEFSKGMRLLVEKIKREQIQRVPAHQITQINSDEIPHGFISVKISAEENVIMRCNAYQQLDQLLRDLYIYIDDVYPPYSYGQSWILVQKQKIYGISRVLATWRLFEALEKDKSLNEIELGWSRDVKLKNVGMIPSTEWIIQDPSKMNIHGLALHDTIIAEALTYDMKILKLLRDICEPCTWSEVQETSYSKVLLIQTDFWFESWNDVLCQKSGTMPSRLKNMIQYLIESQSNK